MKLTRISLLVALVAGTMLAITPSLQAQEKQEAPKREGRPGGPEAAKARLDQLAKTLNLTEEQKTKVGEAMKVQTDKMRELRSAGGTPEENREKFRTLREDLNKKMKEILTAEQYEKWQQAASQRRGPGGPPGKREKKAEKN